MQPKCHYSRQRAGTTRRIYCKIPSLFSRFSVHCVFIHVLQALYELVKCNFNAEEALRRLRFNVKVFSGKQTFHVVPFSQSCLFVTF